MITLDDYADIVGPEVIGQLHRLVERLGPRRLININSTKVGGGVAEILNCTVPLFNQLGLDTRWETIQGDQEFFEITKGMHNAFQGQKVKFTNAMIEHFWDKEKHGLYFTADDAEELIFRKKEIYDGAVPSGNSVAMLNLLRLGRMTANAEFEEKAVQIGRAFSRTIWQAPMQVVALKFPSSELFFIKIFLCRQNQSNI